MQNQHATDALAQAIMKALPLPTLGSHSIRSSYFKIKLITKNNWGAADPHVENSISPKVHLLNDDRSDCCSEDGMVCLTHSCKGKAASRMEATSWPLNPPSGSTHVIQLYLRRFWMAECNQSLLKALWIPMIQVFFSCCCVHLIQHVRVQSFFIQRVTWVFFFFSIELIAHHIN